MACKIWNYRLFLKCLLKSQIERGTSLHIRFGLPDTRRQGLSIVLAPGSSWLAAATDSFGRVLLVDVSRGCIYRTWKGSQPLNLRQAIRCERRAHCMVKLKIPLVHHAHNHEGGHLRAVHPQILLWPEIVVIFIEHTSKTKICPAQNVFPPKP